MSNSLEKLMPKKMTEIEVRESALKFCKDMKLPFEVEQRFVDRSIFEHNVRNYTIDDCLAALEGKVGVLSDVKVEDVQDIIIDSYLDKLARFSGTFSHDPRDPYNTPERALAQAILDMLKKKTEK